MSLAKDLTGVGFPALQSVALGFAPAAAVTAAGTTTTDATVLKTAQNNVQMTGTTNDGIRMPDGMPLMVMYVLSAVSGATKVYPPTGAGFNGGTANAALSVAANKSAFVLRYSTTGCMFNLSA